MDKDTNDKECTFHPIINTKKKSTEGLIERNNSWLQKRSEKIRFKTEIEKFKDLENCTFNPKINETKSNTKEEIVGICSKLTDCSNFMVLCVF